MIQTRIVTPKVVEGFVSRQTNLGVSSYDLDELYSPDTDLWRSKVLDLGSPKYPPQIATAPQRYWFDRSRYNNHGAITGATWQRLPSGDRVLSCDGTDDAIDFGNPSILQFGTTTNWSMHVWAKGTSDATNTRYLAFKGWSSSGGADSGWGMYVEANVLTIMARQGGVAFAFSTYTLPDFNWHLFSAVWDRTTNTQYLYSDAVLRDSDSIAAVGSMDSSYKFYVGRGGIGSLTTHKFYQGAVARVLILTKSNSLREIQQIHLGTNWRYI